MSKNYTCNARVEIFKEINDFARTLHKSDVVFYGDFIAARIPGIYKHNYFILEVEHFIMCPSFMF